MNTQSLAARVAKVRELDGKRMQGDWAVQYSYEDGSHIGPGPYTTIAHARNGADDEEYGGKQGELANAAFIAHASQHPAIIEELVEVIGTLSGALESISTAYLMGINDVEILAHNFGEVQAKIANTLRLAAPLLEGR